MTSISTMAENIHYFLSSTAEEDNVIYKMSLDDLDIALLPMNRLLKKYSGNSNSQDICEFKMLAGKKAEGKENDPDFCLICKIEIPKFHMKEHKNGMRHIIMLKLAAELMDRVHKNMMQQSQQHSLSEYLEDKSVTDDNYYCVLCNTVMKQVNRIKHESDDVHKMHIRNTAVLADMFNLAPCDDTKIDDFNQEDDSDESRKTVEISVAQNQVNHFIIQDKETTAAKTKENSVHIDKNGAVLQNGNNIHINSVVVNKDKSTFHEPGASKRDSKINSTDNSNNDPTHFGRSDGKSVPVKYNKNYCDICTMHISNYNLITHEYGKTHKKNVLMKNTAQEIFTGNFCNICNVKVYTMSERNKGEHINGWKHKELSYIHNK